MKIRCPNCSQTFPFSEDLRGRVVECGSCDSQFLVEKSVISGDSADKHYPGEKDPGLAKFKPIIPKHAENVATLHYVERDDSYFQESSSFRIILGILAIIVVVAGTVVFTYGDQSIGGILRDVSQEKRYFLAGFLGLAATILFFLAFKKRRFLGILLGIVGSLIIFSFAINNKAFISPVAPGGMEKGAVVPEATTSPTEAPKTLKDLVVFAPVQKQIDESKKAVEVVGVYANNVRGSSVLQVSRFLKRIGMSPKDPGVFPRDNDCHLYVISPTSVHFSDFCEKIKPLGMVEEIDSVNQLVSIAINPESLVERTKEDLEDQTNGNFYQLNYRELRALDPERVKRAADRLAAAEPKVYRSDISADLKALLKETNPATEQEYISSITKALDRWAEPDDKEVTELVSEKVYDFLVSSTKPDGNVDAKAVPESFVAFLVNRKWSKVLPLLKDLWFLEPSKWESALISFGAEAEPLVLPFLEPDESKASLPLQRAVIRILTYVGTSQSLPALQNALKINDSEIQVSAQRAIDSIKNKPSTPSTPEEAPASKKKIP